MPFPINISPLPLKTDRTLRAVPYVTYAVCFINIIVYLNQLHLSPSAVYQLTNQYGFVITRPSLGTLFSYGFLHVELFHLLGNLLVLWLVGTVLESAIGSIVFGIIYFASLVSAIVLYGLIAKIFLPETLSIPLNGASGAVAGVMGLAAFRYARLRVLTLPLISFSAFLPFPIPLPLTVWVPLWLYSVFFAGTEVLEGIQEISAQHGSYIAHWAHIGGLALGALMALLVNAAREGKREYVLEETTKAAAGEGSKAQSQHEVAALLRERPDDPELLEAMAGLALVQGQQEESRLYYIKAIRYFLATGLRDRAAICYLNVQNTFPATVFLPREQIVLASQLESLGHFPEAVQAFTALAEKYSEREEAQTALLRAALIHHRYLKHPADAVDLLTTLVTRYPESPWLNLANERLREAKRALPAGG